VNLSRRRFLQAGLFGAGALLLARVAYRSFSPAPLAAPSRDARAYTILAGIAAVLLGDGLPADVTARRQAIEITLVNVEAAIAGLPLHAQKELDDLISLLAFAPTRCLLAGIWTPWEEAQPQAVARFLHDWRTSRFALLRSAYQALHQLLHAAWYGSETAWQEVGYPGPPALQA